MFLLNLLCGYHYMFGDKIFKNMRSDEADALMMGDGPEVSNLFFDGIGIYDKELFSLAAKDKSVSEAYVMEAFFLIRKLMKMAKTTKHEFNKTFLIETCFKDLKTIIHVSGLDPVA